MKQSLTLYFIHGAGGTGSKWRRVEGYLGELRYKILTLPGHDEDNRPMSSTIEEFASVCSSEIDEDGIVIGHSMGGLIGIELAAINEKVKGLVLANSHYELPVHPKILEQLEAGVFPDNFFYASYAKDADQQLLHEEKAELHKNAMSVNVNDFECCAKYREGKTALEQLNIPVLAIFSTEDKLVPPNAKEQLLSVKPDLQTETIEGAGHYAILEKSSEFTDAVLKFKASIQEQHEAAL
ncbi:alpha/beta hydrolase [Bacillus tianshenii]|nr:alpha/beta hydrolase [Bacillus tianshenii]